MAHVPKREPCVTCKNQVFFAERLVINDSLYHRTCFKCARCNSVLTLGNFYETENDHEYCCETCPDEERTCTTRVDEMNRLSMAQKIAIFETESSNVLKKSLSDEEKSNSLSRQAPANSAALSTFLTTQITLPKSVVNDDESTLNSTNSDTESEDDEPSMQPSISKDEPSKVSISNNTVDVSDQKVFCDTLVVTKDLAQGKNSDAIEIKTETNHESYADKKIVESTSKSTSLVEEVPEQEEDLIEQEFEKLAEDAVENAEKLIAVEKLENLIAVKEAEKLITVEKVERSIAVENHENVEELIAAVESTHVPTEILIEQSRPVSEPEKPEDSQSSDIEQNKTEEVTYPTDLDPFGGEDTSKSSSVPLSVPEQKKNQSLNPFGSDSEDEEEQPQMSLPSNQFATLPKPPRPPPPKTQQPASTNPFGSDNEDDVASKTPTTRTPVPTPRKQIM